MGAEASKPDDDGLDSSPAFRSFPDQPRNAARSGILAGTGTASIYNQGAGNARMYHMSEFLASETLLTAASAINYYLTCI
jgi:hypothetical protein